MPIQSWIQVSLVCGYNPELVENDVPNNSFIKEDLPDRALPTMLTTRLAFLEIVDFK